MSNALQLAGELRIVVEQIRLEGGAEHKTALRLQLGNMHHHSGKQHGPENKQHGSENKQHGSESKQHGPESKQHGPETFLFSVSLHAQLFWVLQVVARMPRQCWQR